MPFSAGVVAGSHQDDAAGASIACTLSANIPAGAVILACAGFQGAVGLSGSCVDSDGNGTLGSYAGDLFVTGGAILQGVAIFRAVAAAEMISGVDTVTVTFTGDTPTDRRIAVIYYTGHHATPFDESDAQTGTSTTPSSPTVTADANDELYVGIVTYANAGGDLTPGSGYTLRHQYNGAGRHFAVIEDKDGNTAGSASASGTFTGTTATWRMGISAYKPAVAVGDVWVPGIASLEAFGVPLLQIPQIVRPEMRVSDIEHCRILLCDTPTAD